MKWTQLPVASLVLALAAVAFYAGLALGPSMATASQLTAHSKQQEYRIPLQPVHGSLQVDDESQPEYRLALLASSVKAQGNQVVFEGVVQNLTDRPITDLLAVVTLYDGSGSPRLSTSDLVDDTLLLPGQVSTWTVATKYQPELKPCIEFREWHIGSVPTRDDRKD